MAEPSRYAQAGVDIDAGDRVKKRIIQLARDTFTPGVLHRDGAFGGLYSLANLNLKKPVLVSSVDGVGTKVKVATMCGDHSGIGADLVNHCIDDILTCGAQPLLFLDYYACHTLDDSVLVQVVEGMSAACKAAGVSLIGGETAQMSDVYAKDEYDLAGTIIGVVDEDDIIDGQSIKPGDVMFGLPSSGLHTNGYTLARKVLFDEAGLQVDDTPDGFTKSLGKTLIEPHRCYLPEFNAVKGSVKIKGIAHITGGGFEGNVPRVLPDGCAARVDASAWTPPAVFQLMQEKGAVSRDEMYKVFNMGIGLIFIVSPCDAVKLATKLPQGCKIGEIEPGDGVRMNFE
ncbi:MAG: phosphoribosylformylglycinamidine cyclo-ligase [Candidatus Hinthialibacter antarcticus]|nr:phosphoribosylformylglycinamidine cyclo-ligase [Candidatus Hinthialibacter antarcticus]